MPKRTLKELEELLAQLENETQSWEEHRKAVTKAAEADNAAKEEPAPTRKVGTTLADQTGLIIKRTLNDIINKRVIIESGEELLATVQAVTLYEQLKAALKNV